MDWFWYIIASVGAGVGTGLAGLSAATVMVPILIVLCSSFAGETGAYQATAIALASDILGSAVTTFTYAKNRNIDLKRGWLMMVCIITMSAVGSWAAYIVGNSVLGGFTLFLTFFTGIRFLIKPDSSGRKQAAKGEKLDLKGIIISLFFGLTIGFGTGFVGTGGGMMMLIVFTMFLGMELKTAVGTSTFIMTFTALIASVSHILIHPAIVLEKWDVMLLCIVTATTASLVSARFANRVSSRTAGLVTGAVLTLLGAAMLIINYREVLSNIPLITQTLRCFGTLILCIIPSILILILIWVFAGLPDFVFRKLLHILGFSCVTLMTVTSQSWQPPAITAILIAAALYPILCFFEKQTWYEKFFVQKEPGEIRQSLLMLFFTYAAVVTSVWGIFGKQLYAAAAILMWGNGDAAAALVGIPFGKHKLKLKGTDGKKSLEGCAAMLIVSFLFGFVVLFFGEKVSLSHALISAGAAALAGMLTELYTPSKYDTVTVPLAISLVFLLIG